MGYILLGLYGGGDPAAAGDGGAGGVAVPHPEGEGVGQGQQAGGVLHPVLPGPCMVVGLVGVGPQDGGDGGGSAAHRLEGASGGGGQFGFVHAAIGGHGATSPLLGDLGAGAGVVGWECVFFFVGQE